MASFRKLALAATLVLGLLPFAAFGCTAIGHEVLVNDSLSKLVKHAGRPLNVDFQLRCMNPRCSEVDTTEHWIYQHRAGQHVVGVLDHKVTSIKYQSLTGKHH